MSKGQCVKEKTSISFAKKLFLSEPKYHDAVQLLIHQSNESDMMNYILFEVDPAKVDMKLERRGYDEDKMIEYVLMHVNEKKYAMVVVDNVIIRYLTQNEVEAILNNPKTGEGIAYNTWMNLFR